MVLAIDGYGQSLRSIELYQLLESSQQSFELQQQQSRIYPDLDVIDLSRISNTSSSVTATYKMEVYGPLYTYYRAGSTDYKHRFIKNKESSKSKSTLQAKPWDLIRPQQSLDYQYATFMGAAGGFPINSTRSDKFHQYVKRHISEFLILNAIILFNS